MKRGEQAEVVDVISPLTVLLDDKRIVRLSGIDIPGAYGEDISSLAVIARDILKDMLVGERVQLYQTKDKKVGLTNRMGHDLVHMERIDDEAWVQGTLLQLGLARVKTNPHNVHLADEMLELERKARDQETGLWQDGTFSIVDATDAERTIGTFSLVEGVVESVALKKNRIYVNFGKDWRTDFTLSIAPEDKRLFLKQKIDPMKWGGKRIRARGSIREYNGPYLEISHPEAIEFLDEKPEDAPSEEKTEE